MNGKFFLSFLKQSFLSLFIINILFANISLASALEIKSNFSDVPQTHPDYVAISTLVSTGILKGYDDNTFKPDQTINRAESLKIILTAASLEPKTKPDQSSFKDVSVDSWFAPYVAQAVKLGVIKGNDDGTFAPEKPVNKAEFIKMLLIANNAQISKVDTTFKDVPADSWFASYINYAGYLGIIEADKNGNALPSKELNRSEASAIMYLLILIRKSSDTQLLLNTAEAELAQIDIYVGNSNIDLAKKASGLAVDITQQAILNLPSDKVVLGAAKLAKAYDFLVNAFIMGLNKKYTEAADWANKAIAKATEAWEVNSSTQPIAKHIKDLSRKVLTQVGGTEQ